jgi:hypothetical protein
MVRLSPIKSSPLGGPSFLQQAITAFGGNELRRRRKKENNHRESAKTRKKGSCSKVGGGRVVCFSLVLFRAFALSRFRDHSFSLLETLRLFGSFLPDAFSRRS